MSATKSSSFDKLERLFSKKVGTSLEPAASAPVSAPAVNNRSSGYASSSVSLSLFVSRKSSLANALPGSPTEPMSLDDVHFPEPSFMCPKIIKMAPRDDRINMRTSRPGTGRSMSVSDAPASASAGAAPAVPNSSKNAAHAGLRDGATFARSPLGPPVCLSTLQARSRSATAPRSTPGSRRSSCNTSSSTPFSSSSSSYHSSSETSFSPDADGSTIPQLPNTLSLLQRRDLSLAPLCSFDNFQLDQNTGDAATITINSGQVSPSTTHQATSSFSSDSAQSTGTQPEPTIVGDDDVHNLQELSELVTKTKGLHVETPLRYRESFCAPICLPQIPPAPAPAPTYLRRLRSTRRPKSQRYKRHLPKERAPSSPSSVLMEPNLGDFLSLGDDDIAEDVPASAKKADEAGDVASNAAHDALIQALSTKSLPATPRMASGSPPSSPAPRRMRNAPSRSPSIQAPSPPTCQVPQLPSLPAPSPPFLKSLPGMPTSAGGRPLTPVGDSRMAAAFEIARIAARYQFDLAYVATIWPKNMAYPRSASASSMQSVSASLPSSPMSRTTRSDSRASQKSQISMSSTASNGLARALPRQPKLAFQFLAAFGLATVKTPCTLLAPMHQKILNAKQQWTEFSRSDLAQGFGCAFHCGHAPVVVPATPPQREWRPSTADDCDADTEQDASSSGSTTPRPTLRGNSSPTWSRTNNRGIVFVAYRNKKIADERAARGEQDDLEALYRDVKALVQTFYDAHAHA